MTDTVIELKNVSMMFNLSREREERLKEYVLNFLRGRLFFDEFWALKDVSLELKKGESLGVIGRNGAGKSTLLKLVSGIIKPTKGCVKASGVVSPMVELGGGFDANLSAKENVFFIGAMHGLSRKFLESRLESIIEFAELEDFVNVPVRNFSSGMNARLSFAIATLVNPDILVADEVLSVGDMNFRKKCEQRLNQIVSTGATILFVSHSLPQVKAVCDRCLWLERGQPMMLGNCDEVCEAYTEFMAENAQGG